MNNNAEATEKYPKRRWLVWAILTLAFIIAYFHRVSPTFVIDRLMVDFNTREGAVLGSVAAIYFYVYVAMQIPAGMLADFWGPRYTITAGMIVAGAGSLVFGLAPTLFYLFLGRFLVGLGVAVVFVCILKALGNWFPPAEFSTVTGATIFFGTLGAVASTTPLALVVNNFSWRTAFWGVGFISLGIAFACWWAVRDHPPGSPVPLKKRVLPPGENKKMFLQVVSNSATWYPSLVMFGLYGTLITFFGAWGGPYLMQVHGLTRSQAANLLLFIALGMMAGSLGGFISDRLRMRKAPFLFCVILYLTCWLLLTFWGVAKPPLGSLYVILFLMGASGGGASPVLAMTCAKEAHPHHISGLATGTTNMGAFLGIALLQPFMGYILDRNWEGIILDGVKIYPQEAYFKAFLVCLAVLTATAWTVLLIKETYAASPPPYREAPSNNLPVRCRDS